MKKKTKKCSKNLLSMPFIYAFNCINELRQLCIKNILIYFDSKYFPEGTGTQAEVPDGSKYIQTVPDGKYLCPDRPRRKLPMSRLSCVRQTFVRSCPDFRAFTRLSCVHVHTFVRSPDFSAFNRFLCVHVQTFVRSTDFRAFMSRLLCVHPIFVRSTDFCA